MGDPKELDELASIMCSFDLPPPELPPFQPNSDKVSSSSSNSKVKDSSYCIEPRGYVAGIPSLTAYAAIEDELDELYIDLDFHRVLPPTAIDRFTGNFKREAARIKKVQQNGANPNESNTSVMGITKATASKPIKLSVNNFVPATTFNISVKVANTTSRRHIIPPRILNAHYNNEKYNVTNNLFISTSYPQAPNLNYDSRAKPTYLLGARLPKYVGLLISDNRRGGDPNASFSSGVGRNFRRNVIWSYNKRDEENLQIRQEDYFKSKGIAISTKTLNKLEMEDAKPVAASSALPESTEVSVLPNGSSNGTHQQPNPSPNTSTITTRDTGKDKGNSFSSAASSSANANYVHSRITHRVIPQSLFRRPIGNATPLTVIIKVNGSVLSGYKPAPPINNPSENNNKRRFDEININSSEGKRPSLLNGGSPVSKTQKGKKDSETPKSFAFTPLPPTIRETCYPFSIEGDWHAMQTVKKDLGVLAAIKEVERHAAPPIPETNAINNKTTGGDKVLKAKRSKKSEAEAKEITPTKTEITVDTTETNKCLPGNYRKPAIATLALCDGPLRTVTLVPGNLPHPFDFNEFIPKKAEIGNSDAMKDQENMDCWICGLVKETLPGLSKEKNSNEYKSNAMESADAGCDHAEEDEEDEEWYDPANKIYACAACGIQCHRSCVTTFQGLTGTGALKKWLCEVCHASTQAAVSRGNKGAVKKEETTPTASSRPVRVSRLNSTFGDDFVSGDTKGVKLISSCLVTVNPSRVRPAHNCLLCPHKGGAMTQLPKAEGGGWVHDLCHLYTYNNPRKSSKVFEAEICAICGMAEG